MANQWQLQEAKSKFSHIVEKACNEGPQFVTKHGDNAVVVISYDDYQRMVLPENNLVDFLRSSPFAGTTETEEFTRDKEMPRDIEL
ncbi:MULTISPECIES: type II toxin-antitoxin system Phd/YefM family antitoxin [Gammaproteobacteria]|uniref:type II toxin-antitoxin system Phd/YefM family antitoxin n=1 Tax=Gammaproteobacteria TaxID=1236 RepID=UPI001ADC2083|nr:MULTISPECIES: type II toxin-antitoxin system Phd/YefM family antitoxin [Gammaproteobacteria]MBO9484366.1 type II toxin-antitoxin system Phd/YefM family antitoxin [Salinisphaera sp. G21_0]MBO9493586.1 type II toxin-antitoxin system Phd/YefM family antitoxin [Thalassotalea sp. G20_0]